MFFTALQINTQRHSYSGRSLNRYSNRYRRYSSNRYNRYSRYNYTHAGWIQNDCLNFYYGYDTNDVKFKSVTVTEFIADDSTLVNKKMENKERTSFNKKGQKVLYVQTDTIGVMDSDIYEYDARYYRTREINYKRDNLNHLTKVKDEIWTYDKHGFENKDSNWVLGARYGGETPIAGKTKPEIFYDYDKNDSAGNVLEDISISHDDTTVTYNRYNKYGRIYSETRNGGEVTKEYEAYDTAGNEISRIEQNSSDTMSYYYSFNEKGWLLSSSEANGKNITEVTAIRYEKNKGYTKTVDETPIGDGISCPNNSRSISVYDTADNLLNEVVTSEKSGKPFVTRTNHIYVRKNGYIVADTAINEEEGYLYSLSSTGIKTWKYDAHGNELETTDEGGGEYSRGGKTTTKSYFRFQFAFTNDFSLTTNDYTCICPNHDHHSRC